MIDGRHLIPREVFAEAKKLSEYCSSNSKKMICQKSRQGFGGRGVIFSEVIFEINL